MMLRTFVCGVLLGIAGVCSAADMTYTYTGNLFESNNITATPSRLIAHFVFDFDHSPQAADNVYAIKSWDVSAAGLNFSQATQSHLARFKFAFDNNMNIVDWDLIDANTSDWSGFLSESGRFAYNGRAEDLAATNVTSGPYAAVQDNPGIWTVSAAPVPEPASYLSLIAGLVCLAGWRRRAGKRQAM